MVRPSCNENKMKNTVMKIDWNIKTISNLVLFRVSSPNDFSA